VTARRRSGALPIATPPIVVDASIAVQWFAREPGSDAAAGLIDSNHRLIAPDIMPVETANAWWKKVRRGEMSTGDLDEAIVSLLALEIEWSPTTTLLARAARVATEIGHPVYDCVYLVLSTIRGARFATADDRLRRAATRREIALWTA
jgi:predicted nucleic acid-binding protein